MSPSGSCRARLLLPYSVAAQIQVTYWQSDGTASLNCSAQAARHATASWHAEPTHLLSAAANLLNHMMQPI